MKKSRKIKPKSHFVHLYNVDYIETFYTTEKTGHASGRSGVCLFKKKSENTMSGQRKSIIWKTIRLQMTIKMKINWNV